MKRFITEYAAHKKAVYQKLIKMYPDQEAAFLAMIDRVDKAVWLIDRGYITVDEGMKAIADV